MLTSIASLLAIFSLLPMLTNTETRIPLSTSIQRFLSGVLWLTAMAAVDMWLTFAINAPMVFTWVYIMAFRRTPARNQSWLASWRAMDARGRRIAFTFTSVCLASVLGTIIMAITG